MPISKEDRAWLIAIMEDKVNHLDSSPPTQKRLDIVEADLKNKVSWKQFVWIIGILIVFMTSILGAIWVQVRNNGATANNTQIEVSYMRGMLSGDEEIK